MGRPSRIDAVQVNFAEHEATALGRAENLYHQYRLEWSAEGKSWETLADKSANHEPDRCPARLRPASGSDGGAARANHERAYGRRRSVQHPRPAGIGSGQGDRPAKAPKFEAIRDRSDVCNAVVRWEIVNDAEGYVVRYGIAPDKLYLNREIRGQKEIVLHDLSTEAKYYFAVDAFNANGRGEWGIEIAGGGAPRMVRRKRWSDVNYLAPGALYDGPTYDGERSPGGTLNYAARRFVVREDILPAPMFALSFSNGASVAVMDSTPRGDTIVDETKLSKTVMTDARIQFGALEARQRDDDAVEFGFWFPGSVSDYGGAGPGAPPKTRSIRRYHPIAAGVAHIYQVSFRFGQNESFRDVTRNSWRWVWNTLKPAVTPIDVEQMRRVLTDHLVAQAATIDGRTAVPFVLSTVTDQLQWNWAMVAMGFVGKNIECADQLLREGDSRPHRARAEDAPDRSGDYLVADPCSPSADRICRAYPPPIRST